MNLSFITNFLTYKNNNILKKSFLIYKSPFIEGYFYTYAKINFFFKILLKKENEMYPNFFLAEKKSIKVLKKTSSFETVDVLAYQDWDKKKQNGFILSYWKDMFLITETDLFYQAALKLVKLHQYPVEKNKYGYYFDNYYSGFLQKNSICNNWIDFYSKNRIIPLLALLKKKKLWNLNFEKMWDQFFLKLPNVLNSQEKASLVHGDFWIGNLYVSKYRKLILIDPAIHFAPREWDIACAIFWKGFPKDFYKHYNFLFPLEKGFELRLEIYSLYYQLINLILFEDPVIQKKIIKILKKLI